MTRRLLVLLFILDAALVNGQIDTSRAVRDTLPGRFYVLQNVDREGEVMPEIEIKEVNIIGRRKGVSVFKHWRYERLVYNVKKVYPYALVVRHRLDQVTAELRRIPDEKGRKEYMKQVEKQVFNDYEDDMRQMTITQGKLLIKLIDRETDNTSYDLIREYRGRISAAFWQGVARIFGTNLKEEYDPFGEDAIIERIIQEIDAGRL
ncbi:MAG: DUF4294 domain-containing protein [Bacteroidales bacterium]